MKVFVTGTRGIPNIMGGVESHCEELFPRLAKKGFDITIARRDTYAKESLKEWKGVKLVDIASPHYKSLEAILHTFRAIIYAKKTKQEIVHIHAIGPALLTPLAKLLRLKVVFTHHGFDYDRAKWNKMAKFCLRLGERMGCRYADDVIVISEVIRSTIKEKYGREKNVHLIYNGTPKTEFVKDDVYFHSLGIEPRKYILGMSRFVPEKNLHDLIAAFGKLKETDFKLVIAGDADFEDDYTRNLRKLAKDNNVVLTGFIKGDKLHSILSNAALYCLPSSHEGLPIALLEAMSYSLPVVVSDIPANIEVNLPASDYFPCGDVEALSVALQKKLSHPYVDVPYDMSKYDWNTIAEQVAAVYNRERK